MSELTWDEFQEIPVKQWKQKIQAGLKGADYNETLIWKTNEGTDVKPFYTHEDSAGLHPIPKKNTTWNICQKIRVDNTSHANAKALDALKRGAESLLFVLPSEKTDIPTLTEGIDLTAIPIYVQPEFLSVAFAKNLHTFASENEARIHLHTDIIGNLTRTGNWYFNVKEDHEHFTEILTHSKGFKTAIGVDLSLYQNAGASIVQQLAYALSHANEYGNLISNEATISDEDRKALGICFKAATGSNYFFEIAKIRALRLLWKTLAPEYGMAPHCHIFATPTTRNKTLYDYNVNMLRTTTEYMSAVLGGADTVCSLAYDAIYHKPNEFGERIARNQLLILKHESYFDKVSNPAEGAYYIEHLTVQLAEKALERFKQIEAGGGFLAQLRKQTIQRKIKEHTAKEQQQFNATERVLIGTNTYLNENDKMKQELEIHPFVTPGARKTVIEPIIAKRLAEAMEQERLKQE